MDREINKEIPRKPIRIEKSPDLEFSGICPTCKEGELFLGWSGRSEKCPVCGQKIRWE